MRGPWDGGPAPFMEQDATGGGAAPTAPTGGEPAPSGSGQDDPFKVGYGKGIDKGKRELLKELGVTSVDDLQKALKTAAEAAAAAQKQAEEQGKYKELYEALRAEHEPIKAKVAAHDAAQKAELDALTEKLSPEDRATLNGLTTEQALTVARRLARDATAPVGARTTGVGTAPADAKAEYDKLLKVPLFSKTPEQWTRLEQLEAELRRAGALQ